MVRNVLPLMVLLVTCSLGMTVQSGTSSCSPMRRSFQEGFCGGRGIPQDCAGDEELHRAYEAGQQLAKIHGCDDVRELAPRAYERGYEDHQKRPYLKDQRFWIGATGGAAFATVLGFCAVLGYIPSVFPQ